MCAPLTCARAAFFFAPTQAREITLTKEHTEYLDDHPEVKALLADFISSALAEQPQDVFQFAAKHFTGTACSVPEVQEPAPMAEPDDVGSGGGGADDMDNMDDLDEMGASANSELTAYLRNVFDSMDEDSSGTISKPELLAKLGKDQELQQLLEAAGGDGNQFVLEQLDLDGDGEITWMEFEAMLSDRGW